MHFSQTMKMKNFLSSSITRHRKITKLEPKIGKVRYAFGRYKNLCRATIPINEDYYLLLMFDFASRDFDDLTKSFRSKLNYFSV